MGEETIVITGTGRSGTSLVTKIFYDAIYEHTYDYPKDEPPYAGMEFRELAELNDKIIEDIEQNGVSYPDVELTEKLAKRYKKEMEGVLKDLPKLIKDPRFSQTLPIWDEAVGIGHVIICVRNPYDSAKSAIEVWGGDEGEIDLGESTASRLGFLVWWILGRTMSFSFIRFPHLIDNYMEMAHLCRFLGIEPEELEEAHKNNVNKDLVHFDSRRNK